jgi:alpha-L-arabinofuranosidase
MKPKTGMIYLLAAVLLGISVEAIAAGKAAIQVDFDGGTTISPSLYGIFFEEINRAGDGGLFGEMLENRSFEDDRSTFSAWKSTGKGQLTLDRTNPINPRNETSLRINLPGGTGGIINSGFSGVGIGIEQNTTYTLSLYAHCSQGFDGPLTARLEGRDGAILAETAVKDITAEWKKYNVTLKARATDTTARLVLEAAGQGSLWLDMVSLTPAKTWKNHGMRNDLAGMIENMQPRFVRFPGGCFVEGDRLANAVRWKETIGDPAQRKGNRCIWGYQTTGGFGVHEFLQWCEDLGAEAMYVINCGMAHEDHVPMDKMQEYVQDALDLIEYAKGPVTSTWGAKRAAAGHPEPFNLMYLEIGNENGGPLYHERYALFHDAIKAKYPEIKLIACVWNGTPQNRPLDIIDEHYYNTPRFFMEQAGMYDNYDRKGPKVYVGEYAVTQGCGGGNLIAALGEAAYMTGLERNSDHVVMASYAPLFVNPSMRRWNPNAIVFDQSRCYGTPSYHVQAMFSRNAGDTVCPSRIDASSLEMTAASGGISVGTWLTQAEFKDIAVTKGDEVLFKSDFSKGNNGFRFHGGHWIAEDGVLRQTGGGESVLAGIGDASWGSRYTLSLKARKISGEEGFLIGFQLAADTDKHWLNLGGWRNTQHGLEGIGSDRRLAGKIETGRWYDIRIELKNGQVDCYLDQEQIFSEKEKPLQSLYAAVSKTADGKELILKAVNVSENAIETDISISGVKTIEPAAKGWVLTSDNMNDENTFERPVNVIPKDIRIHNAGTAFVHSFPARSVTILRLKTDN